MTRSGPGESTVAISARAKRVCSLKIAQRELDLRARTRGTNTVRPSGKRGDTVAAGRNRTDRDLRRRRGHRSAVATRRLQPTAARQAPVAAAARPATAPRRERRRSSASSAAAIAMRDQRRVVVGDGEQVGPTLEELDVDRAGREIGIGEEPAVKRRRSSPRRRRQVRAGRAASRSIAWVRSAACAISFASIES